MAEHPTKRPSPKANRARRDTLARARPTRADTISSVGEFGLSVPGFIGTKAQRDSLRLAINRAQSAQTEEEPSFFDKLSELNIFDRLAKVLQQALGRKDKK